MAHRHPYAVYSRRSRALDAGPAKWGLASNGLALLVVALYFAQLARLNAPNRHTLLEWTQLVGGMSTLIVIGAAPYLLALVSAVTERRTPLRASAVVNAIYSCGYLALGAYALPHSPYAAGIGCLMAAIGVFNLALALAVAADPPTQRRA